MRQDHRQPCKQQRFIGFSAPIQTKNDTAKPGKGEIRRKDIRETEKTRCGSSSIIGPEKALLHFLCFTVHHLSCASSPRAPRAPIAPRRQAHRKFYYSILIIRMTLVSTAGYIMQREFLWLRRLPDAPTPSLHTEQRLVF